MDLTIDHLGLWARLRLCRPARKAALNTGLRAALAEAMVSCAAGTGVRAVVLTGAGGKLAAMSDIAKVGTQMTAQGANTSRKADWAAIRAFRDRRKPELQGK